MDTPRVLVVDEDGETGSLIRQALGGRGHVDSCDSAEAALAALGSMPADILVARAGTLDGSGAALLEEIRSDYPCVDAVMLVPPDDDAPRFEDRVARVPEPAHGRTLTDMLDQVLERRRLAADNTHLRTTLSTLESCAELVRCLDPDEIYAVALNLLLSIEARARGLVQFRRMSMPLSDGVAFHGFSTREVRLLRDRLGDVEPIDIDDVAELNLLDAGAMHDLLAECGIDAGDLLVVPLRGREGQAGLVYVLGDDRPFTQREREAAHLVAEYGQLALHNAERYTGAKERALVDDVTGLHNVRYLLDSLDHELRRADRFGAELCVLFLDVDCFKGVNDHHGHLAGTQTLRHVGQIMQQCIRRIDTLVRYGGDEFTILLTNTPLDEGIAVAERIRESIAESTAPTTSKQAVRVTISIGVAAYPRDAGQRDALLHVADQAMYRAKALGRNRVAVAGDLDHCAPGL